MDQPGTLPAVPAPASAAEALAMVQAGLRYLADADPAQMPTQVQAECLHALEQAEATITAVRAWILGAFTAGQGHSADADCSPGAWLIHKTKVTRGAAAGHTGWMRRAETHPLVMTALAEGTVLTESVARKLCGWTDRLPEECRQAADEILVTAARAGADERGLAGLAAEICARAPHEGPDDGWDDGSDGRFEDRWLRLETTFDGAGVLRGDLSPECAALAGAVLGALSAPVGPEDTRTQAQRYHDALEEAARRLVAADMLPKRAGQPVKAWVHTSLAELRASDKGSRLENVWVAAMAARWAAARGAASVSGGDGAAWLEGDAARAAACDASLIPVVTGDVDLGALDDLVDLCLQLAGHGHWCGSGREPEPLTAQGGEMLRHAIIGKVIDLLSGPGGLASFLRRQQLDGRLAGPSVPLDVGVSSTIPAAIRAAVILRDQHCQWAGGCSQPAGGCQVHHIRHQADGGPTSVDDCALYCTFHHLVAIHRWGWTVQRHPDGTSTARSPDGSKILYSHGPPPQPG